jgi:hypothetical protein
MLCRHGGASVCLQLAPASRAEAITEQIDSNESGRPTIAARINRCSIPLLRYTEILRRCDRVIWPRAEFSHHLAGFHTVRLPFPTSALVFLPRRSCLLPFNHKSQMCSTVARRAMRCQPGMTGARCKQSLASSSFRPARNCRRETGSAALCAAVDSANCDERNDRAACSLARL